MGTFALEKESFIFPNWSPVFKGFMININRTVFFLLSEAGETNKKIASRSRQVTMLPVTGLSGNKHMEPESFCGIFRQLTAHPFSSPLQRALLYVDLQKTKT